jgi:hypothetical protein
MLACCGRQHNWATPVLACDTCPLSRSTAPAIRQPSKLIEQLLSPEQLHTPGAALHRSLVAKRRFGVKSAILPRFVHVRFPPNRAADSDHKKFILGRNLQRFRLPKVDSPSLRGFSAPNALIEIASQAEADIVISIIA